MYLCLMVQRVHIVADVRRCNKVVAIVQLVLSLGAQNQLILICFQQNFRIWSSISNLTDEKESYLTCLESNTAYC